MKSLFRDCLSWSCHFATPHLEVVKYSQRRGAAGINRYVFNAQPKHLSNDGHLAWPCHIELDGSHEAIQRMKSGGPTPVRTIRAIDVPDWSAGEMVHELLFGIRDCLGPMSFDLIDEPVGAGIRAQFWGGGQRILIDAIGCWINGRRVQIDNLVPAKVRERLSFSTVDDTWNMSLGYVSQAYYSTFPF